MDKNQITESKDFNLVSSQFVPYIEKRASRYKPNGFGKEDLIQEGMIALFYAVDTYREEKGASFSAYACKCINNRMASFIRTHLALKSKPLSAYVPLDEEPVLFSADPAQQLIEKEEVSSMRAKLFQCLSDRESKVLRLYLEGESIKGIASATASEEKNVQNTLYRVRQKLKKIM